MGMPHEEYQYIRLLNELVYDAPFKGDRTGTGTFSVFTRSLRFKLNDGKTFPLLTTKTTHWKSIVHELLWFIAGDTNIKYLNDNGVRIWNEWADENGDLGPVYGHQWRNFGGSDRIVDEDQNTVAYGVEGVDQLAEIIERIKTNPEDRRLIVSAWNPQQLPDMRLPPCHMIFQFYSRAGKLSCHINQRSCDTFLGVPFNIASYALLLLMVAKVTGQVADELIWTGGDVHLYSNHVEQAKTQMERRPYPFPSVVINGDINSIDDIKFGDIELQNYRHHDTIKAKVAV